MCWKIINYVNNSSEYELSRRNQSTQMKNLVVRTFKKRFFFDNQKLFLPAKKREKNRCNCLNMRLDYIRWTDLYGQNRHAFVSVLSFLFLRWDNMIITNSVWFCLFNECCETHKQMSSNDNMNKKKRTSCSMIFYDYKMR